MVQWRIPSIHTERNEAQSAENVVENETEKRIAYEVSVSKLEYVE